MVLGRKKYVPPRVFEELDGIKADYDIQGKRSDAKAFKKMAELSRVGREVDRMRSRFVMADIFGSKPKKKRKR